MVLTVFCFFVVVDYNLQILSETLATSFRVFEEKLKVFFSFFVLCMKMKALRMFSL